MGETGLSFTSLKPEELTWDTAYRLFSLRCRSQNLSDSTLATYARILAAFRRWVETAGAPAPAATSKVHLRGYLEAARARGCRSATVDVHYRTLKTFWRFLRRDGLILVDPMEAVEHPRLERRFAKPFTEEQLRTLLANLNTRDILQLRDYALIVFLADTGLRINEALSLRVCDIDWSSNSAIVMGKGRKERRIVFGETARRALMTWIRRRVRLQEGDWLWINHFGERLRSDHFQHRLKQHTQRAGIAEKRLSAHALRHFFALNYLRGGGDVMTLQKLMGHSDLEMVRRYLAMTDADVLAAHRRASPLDRMGPLPNTRRKVRLGR